MNDATVVVRRAVREDAAEVARLAGQLGYPVSADDIAVRLSALGAAADHFVAVAELHPGVLSGWVSAERRLILESGEKIEISGLIVDESLRKAGIGRRLVQAVERWARELGMCSIVVRSNVERPASHSFYLGAGYRRNKTQHVYVKSNPGPAGPE